ncbi:arylformamidase [Starmerella bacillaris]|uniref:Arylformamidase n=1 Tax=Starmerella bacillaris TaxID=1247836 RepID=A0AAV5RPX7_STABA|nr:arylformamidase [Starmerella bacillaris]
MSARSDDNIHKWGPDERHRMWVDGVKGGTWFIFVHGGAWRDASKTHLTGKHLCETIEAKFPGMYSGFASLDYRLSPNSKHPDPVTDVTAAVNVVKWEFSPEKIVLAGHSCGAMLAAQAYDQLFHSSMPVTNFFGIDGIYDLQSLVKEYPDYEEFVSQEFGPRSEWPSPPDYKTLPNLTLIHSVKDTLLSLNQSKEVQKVTGCKLIELPNGDHDEIIEDMDISEYFKV